MTSKTLQLRSALFSDPNIISYKGYLSKTRSKAGRLLLNEINFTCSFFPLAVIFSS